MKLSRGFGVLVLAAAACGGDDVDVVAETDGTQGATTTTGVTSPTTALPGDADDAEDTVAPMRPDLGGTTGDTFEPEDTDDGTGDGNPIIDADPFDNCPAVDFLYVIDNSGSMLPHQQKLIDAFPALAAVTQALIPASVDSHLMVVKTDEGWGGHCIDHCDEIGLCLDNLGFDCSMTQIGCDAELGAGVVHPYGMLGRNEPCELEGEMRYVLPEEPDIVPAMTCLAALGVRMYDTPRPADALVAALGDGQLGPGGCNDGFLRDDAMLVVTIVTDKSDTTSSGTPAQWYDALVAAKNGRAQDIFVVSLLAEDLQGCSEEAQAPGDLGTFVDLFPNAMRLNVCAESLESALMDTVIPIGQACEAMASN